MPYAGFSDTPLFTQQIAKLVSDDGYAGFQELLISDPAQGYRIDMLLAYAKNVRSDMNANQVKAPRELVKELH